MIKLKVTPRQKSPFHLCADRPTLTVSDVNRLIEIKLQELAQVSHTGLMEDLDIAWDSEIILDCGTIDCILAELDTTILN